MNAYRGISNRNYKYKKTVIETLVNHLSTRYRTINSNINFAHLPQL